MAFGIEVPLVTGIGECRLADLDRLATEILPQRAPLWPSRARSCAY
jgi:hypothetical protein